MTGDEAEEKTPSNGYTCTWGSEEERETYFSKANVVTNIVNDGKSRIGECNKCQKKVDVVCKAISCLFCKKTFHAVGCTNNKTDIAPSTGFDQHLLPSSTKTGGYSERYGKFCFVCEYCMNCFEADVSDVRDDKVENLSNKVEDLSSNVEEIKKLIVSLAENSQNKSSQSQVNEDENSVWSNRFRTENMKRLLYVEKDSSGNQINLDTLRRTCVDEEIKVVKTFETKNKEVGIVVNSEASAKLLSQKLQSSHTVRSIPVKTPTINLVGIPIGTTKPDLLYNIMQLNDTLRSIRDSPPAVGEDAFQILGIVELRSNPNYCKATIRISNSMRYAIAKLKDRVLIGLTSAKVYDNFYVRRCYKCQKFGHVRADCRSEAACVKCSGDHENSVPCPADTNPSALCCANCKRSSISRISSNTAHSASSLVCPSLQAEQAKLKGSIPFYQSQ